MNSYFIIALLSPALWALVNAFDKYLISHKVRNPIGFSVVAGLLSIIIGVIIAVFLDWGGIEFKAMLYPMIAGGLLGIQLYFYYYVAKKADISYILGIYFIYPLFVTLLSFLFLNEVISFIGYLGMAFTVLGVVLMSVKINKTAFKLGLWMIGLMAITGAFSEFFVKIAVGGLSPLYGVALSNIALGVVLLPALFFRNIRRQFLVEVKNWRFSLISEIITLFSIFTLYLAMDGLPATIVTSLAATQPVFLVLFERIGHGMFGKMVKDEAVGFKLGTVILVVIGVVLLAISTS